MLDITTLVSGVFPFRTKSVATVVRELLQEFSDSYCLAFSGYRVNIRIEHLPVYLDFLYISQLLVDVPELISHAVCTIDVDTVVVVHRGACGNPKIVNTPNAMFERIIQIFLEMYPPPIYQLVHRLDTCAGIGETAVDGFRELAL